MIAYSDNNHAVLKGFLTDDSFYEQRHRLKAEGFILRGSRCEAGSDYCEEYYFKYNTITKI